MVIQGRKKQKMKKRRVNNNILEICADDDNVIISMKEEYADGTMQVNCSGELKNEVAHDFEDEIMAALSICKKTIIDFSQVNYIGSLALSSLLSAQQIIDQIGNKELVLVNLSDSVKQKLTESGLIEVLMVEE